MYRRMKLGREGMEKKFIEKSRVKQRKEAETASRKRVET